MPLCWIFLLKRRRALSNVSFSPTRTSANSGSPPPAEPLDPVRALGATDAADRLSQRGRQSRRSIAEPLRVVKPLRRGARGRPRQPSAVRGGRSSATSPTRGFSPLPVSARAGTRRLPLEHTLRGLGPTRSRSQPGFLIDRRPY